MRLFQKEGGGYKNLKPSLKTEKKLQLKRKRHSLKTAQSP
jgi:hypothetical protein